MDEPPANDELDPIPQQLEEIEGQCRPKEDALQESEESFRVMLNSTHDLALLAKRDGTVIAVNTRMADRFGKSPEEFRGLNIYSLMPSQAAAIRKSKAQEMLRTKQLVNYTEERKEHFFDCNLFPILNKAGSVKRFAVFVQDVTERFKCEEALRKAGKDLEHRVNEKTMELMEKTKNLQEMNTALKVLLDKRDEDKKELEQNVLLNVREMIEPYLDKLRKTKLNDMQATYLGIIESNLNDIISPFVCGSSINLLNFTPSLAFKNKYRGIICFYQVMFVITNHLCIHFFTASNLLPFKLLCAKN